MITFKHKTILSAVAVILVAGTVFFTSCEKEETKSNGDKTETTDFINKNSQAEYADYFSYSLSFLNEFYSKCNNAYGNNPERMIKICNSGDYANFFKAIGMTESDVSIAAHSIKIEVDRFIEMNPEYAEQLQNTPPCTSCVEESLPQLGGILSDTNGNMALDNDYRPECVLCFGECLPAYLASPVAYLVCVAACNWICNS